MTAALQDSAKRAGGSMPILPRLRRRLGSMLSRFRPPPPLHPAVQKYVRFNEELWGPPPVSRDNAVFLVGIFRWFPCMPGYAHVANHFARKASASIEWYNFYGRTDREIEAIYTSFGAHPGLSLTLTPIDEERAQKVSAEICASLRTKSDVIEITVEGLKIGDLIYDSYMRTKPHPTVNLADPKLAEIIHQAVRITLACRQYFSRRKVVGVIADHFVYIYSGIVTRCALMSGVPVYQVLYCANFFSFAVSYAPGGKSLPVASAYPYYRQIFARLSPAEQAQAREKGRTVIERRLSGHADGVLSIMGAIYGDAVVQSAYTSGSGAPALKDTGRPRILVLLHDFCDGVHNYRDFLFPDFYEWIHFLLEQASATEFDWYVKPHPNAARRGFLAEVNGAVLDELKAAYPKIHFLDPTTSSLQIIQEGIRAMFTGYGTAGHEFAYLGVPVVNAGDNPHIAYGFNLHPRTLEEYAGYVAHADSLEIDIRREDIQEYVYMNYVFCEEELSCGANPMSAEYLASEEYQSKLSRPETLEMLMHRFSADENRDFADYLDHIPHLAEPLSLEVRLRKKRQARATILNT